MSALRAVDPGGSRLDELAAIANAEHEHIWRAGREALEHAVRCGEALLEAQACVERGRWLRWLTANVTVHPTSAYKYMRLARHKDRVLADGVDGVEAGLRLIAAEPWHDRSRLTDQDKAEMVMLVEDHTLEEVARAFNCSTSTVSRWTSDRSPVRYRAPTPAPVPRRPTGRLELADGITDEMIERLAAWLCRRYGDGQLTDVWREDAVKALGVGLGLAA